MLLPKISSNRLSTRGNLAQILSLFLVQRDTDESSAYIAVSGTPEQPKFIVVVVCGDCRAQEDDVLTLTRVRTCRAVTQRFKRKAWD